MEQLSSSLGTNKQEPNIDLAIKLVTTKDKDTVAEIAANLQAKDKATANDCIKVMYEIGKIEPELIVEYLDTFLRLISSENNRMVWRAMYAIAQISPYRINTIDKNFDKIVAAYDEGSVITIDSCIVIFAEVAKANVSNSTRAHDLIINHLKTCRPKEIPQHSEKAFSCINSSNFAEFEQILKDRFDLLSAFQQKRVSKVLNKIENQEFS